jgi:hypothetical protein
LGNETIVEETSDGKDTMVKFLRILPEAIAAIIQQVPILISFSGSWSRDNNVIPLQGRSSTLDKLRRRFSYEYRAREIKLREQPREQLYEKSLREVIDFLKQVDTYKLHIPPEYQPFIREIH